MQTGNIGVKTENIFPVIKKFLYSDQEIFLREIISNAVDATQKLKALAASGEFKGELGDLTIKVEVDKKKKTLTVRDRGIGMNAEEVDKYINQIAFSGAEEFIAKFKTQSEAEAGLLLRFYGFLEGVADLEVLQGRRCQRCHLGMRRQPRVHDERNPEGRPRHRRHPLYQ